MKIIKKKRNEIYINATHYIRDMRNANVGLCWLFKKSANNIGIQINRYSEIQLLDEFFLFSRQVNAVYFGVDFFNYESRNEEYEHREIALAFMIELSVKK